MAPTFNDKSIQGIIDIIHSELGCLGSVTDKSIQGIVDKANAAGANVTDKSIQGIIDTLGPFSCSPQYVLAPSGSIVVGATVWYMESSAGQYVMPYMTTQNIVGGGVRISPSTSIPSRLVPVVRYDIHDSATNQMVATWALPALCYHNLAEGSTTNYNDNWYDAPHSNPHGTYYATTPYQTLDSSAMVMASQTEFGHWAPDGGSSGVYTYRIGALQPNRSSSDWILCSASALAPARPTAAPNHQVEGRWSGNASRTYYMNAAAIFIDADNSAGLRDRILTAMADLETYRSSYPMTTGLPMTKTPPDAYVDTVAINGASWTAAVLAGVA